MESGKYPDLSDILSSSLQAKKEGNNREIYQDREKLEKEGFSWSEKP
jgi:hypothetical protein